MAKNPERSAVRRRRDADRKRARAAGVRVPPAPLEGADVDATDLQTAEVAASIAQSAFVVAEDAAAAAAAAASQAVRAAMAAEQAALFLLQDAYAMVDAASAQIDAALAMAGDEAQAMADISAGEWPGERAVQFAELGQTRALRASFKAVDSAMLAASAPPRRDKDDC